MKKISGIALFCFICASTNAQIANTVWATYNPSIFDSVFVTVTNDSIHQVDGNNNHLVSSWYDENGDTVRILDATGPFRCATPDTGWYRYLIEVDTLTISVLKDSCATRAQAYDGVVLQRVKNLTGVTTHTKSTAIQINSHFPETLKVSTHKPGILSIFTLNGQLVISKKLNPGTTPLSLKRGMYVLSFYTEQNMSTSKVLVY